MTATPRTLPDLIPLATFGPIIFARIDGVFAVHDDGRILYHASVAEWPSTPEAQAAALDASIGAAEATLAMLVAKKAALRPSPLLLPGPTPTPKARTTRRVRCKACGRALVYGFFLRHVGKEHAGMEPAELEYDPELPWPIPDPAAPAEPPAELAGQVGGNA